MVGAEEEEVAKMGCPSLGEHTQIEVVIEESYEFKVSFTNKMMDNHLNFQHHWCHITCFYFVHFSFFGMGACREQ